MVDLRDLLTVRQVAEQSPGLSENKLRWWIFHAETSGIAPALVRIGGRVYIDRAEFNRWLEGQRMAAKPASYAA